ncbi:MAG: Hsp20/alpha crystallin family protein [bacterium]
MRKNKLVPWNWFNKEEEREESRFPVRRKDLAGYFGLPIMQIHKEIDRVFDEIFGGFGFADKSAAESWDTLMPSALFKPNLDISETDKEYSITVELPGVDEKNIELELIENTLKIRGEKKQETEKKDKNYHCVERSYGSFQRSLTLPEDADQEAIRAEYKNGIMTISIPRKPELKPESKKIEIKSK